jgi:hypothetical protein
MRNQSRKTRLADMAATAFAALFLAVNLMVRDPHPAAASVTASAAPHGDPALVITLIFMALGMCVVAYGLYHERHAVKQLARLRMVHLRHRTKLRLRAARRSLSAPNIRHVIRQQRA